MKKTLKFFALALFFSVAVNASSAEESDDCASWMMMVYEGAILNGKTTNDAFKLSIWAYEHCENGFQ